MGDHQSQTGVSPTQPASPTLLPERPPRIEWFWQSNADPWSSESAEWCAYSDVDTAIIEEAFQQKLPDVLLDDFTISFKHLVQISNDDQLKQRPMKRVVSTETSKIRDARFMQSPVNPSAPFGHANLGDFRRKAHYHFKLPGFAYTHENNSLQNPANRRRMVEKAAEGIIIEGNKAGKRRQGEWFAQQLLNVIDGTAVEVWRVCARLYTMQSFLFEKLNECMRLEGDEEHEQLWKSKVPTFGPFSLLLYYLGEYTDEKLTVYRGCHLNDNLIQQYREKLATEPNTAIVFPAFTSTSRNRNTAEQFGNVLFTIEIDRYYDGCDVSPYSNFNEEEILLAPYFMFYIQSCNFNEVDDKWIIHLRSDRIQ